MNRLAIPIALFVCLFGCKKNVDPSLFDAGQTTAVVDVDAGAAAATDTTTPDADLAPLTSAKPAVAQAPKKGTTPAKTATVATPTATAAASGPPECQEAAKICASAHGVATRSLCESKTQECIKKGGRVQ